MLKLPAFVKALVRLIMWSLKSLKLKLKCNVASLTSYLGCGLKWMNPMVILAKWRPLWKPQLNCSSFVMRLCLNSLIFSVYFWVQDWHTYEGGTTMFHIYDSSLAVHKVFVKFHFNYRQDHSARSNTEKKKPKYTVISFPRYLHSPLHTIYSLRYLKV